MGAALVDKPVREANDLATSKWHYHALLECGHDVSFDTEHDFDAEANGLPFEVVLPCGECDARDRTSVSVQLVGAAEAPCACKD